MSGGGESLCEGMCWSNKQIMNVLDQKRMNALVQKMNVLVQMAAGCVGCRGALMFNVRPVEASISHNIFYGQFSVASGSFLVQSVSFQV